MKTFYVTTPIYYANSLPHIGALYTTTVADCLRRYKRQRGFDTYFLTGTDEHGINVQRAAEAAGRTPKEHTDIIVDGFKRMFAAFELDTEHGGYDIFMRTTEPFHYEGVSALWQQIARSKTPKRRDSIYKNYYEGWFCAACAAFKAEDEYVPPQRAGEPPTCPIHETPLDRVSEESYFFRLSDFAEALLDLYETRPDFIRPESRRNEVISFVRGGLQDLSISRLKTSVSWGIPVPDDESHTVYVWLDALTNYITAIGYGNEERERAVGFAKFWPGVHLVGKDILRFHTVYWPAFLMAAGLEQPRSVVVHGMWLDAQGRKMSKTLGNAVDPFVLHRHFTIDAVRYFLLRDMVFGQDGKFSYENLIDRTNSDLASGLGNLTSRTLTMVHRYCGGAVPAPDVAEENRLSAKRAGVDPDALSIATALERARDEFIAHFEEYAFSRALEAVWGIVAQTDKLISDAKPWELAKDAAQRETLQVVLYQAVETLRWLAVILAPVIPKAATAIWRGLNLSGDPSEIDPANLKWGELPAGTQLSQVEAIFPRMDKGKVIVEIEREAQAGAPQAAAGRQNDKPKGSGAEPKTEAVETPAATTGASAQSAPHAGPENVTTLIGIEDFAKVDLRVGEVLTAERVPKADKLLRLTVDLGEAEPRQILAGIAQHYEPEGLIGRKIIVVANLQLRRLRGYESQGMVVAASIGDEGRPVLATFTEDVPNGARLK